MRSVQRFLSFAPASILAISLALAGSSACALEWSSVIDPLTGETLYLSGEDYRPQRAPPIPPQVVSYDGLYGPSTIVVLTPERRLFYVLGQGAAIQYAVGVGRPGFEWFGVKRIARKRPCCTDTTKGSIFKTLGDSANFTNLRIVNGLAYPCTNVGNRRFPGEPRFPGLAAIAMVEAEVERGRQRSRERRYYLCSTPIDARLFARACGGAGWTGAGGGDSAEPWLWGRGGGSGAATVTSGASTVIRRTAAVHAGRREAILDGH